MLAAAGGLDVNVLVIRRAQKSGLDNGCVSL